jgi:tetratricopeptide (TPR) repeat protein
VRPLSWRRREAPADELRELKSRMDNAVNRGDLAGAAAFARAVMDMHADRPARDPYLSAWTYWADALQRLGQHAAAAREYTTMIDTTGPVIGHDHRVIMVWLIKRAAQLGILGMYEEAESDSRAAIEMSAMVQPAGHAGMYRLLAFSNLVAVLIERGMFAEAESAARLTMAEADAITDLPESYVAIVRRTLAASLNAQARHAEAIEVLRSFQPHDPRSIAGFSLVLGTAQLGMGQVAAAELSAREAVASAERFYGPAHYTTLQAGTLRGAVLARQGDIDEARHLLQVNAAAWAEHFGDTHRKTIAAQRELARTDDASP